MFKAPDGKTFATRGEWKKYMFATYYSFAGRTGETLMKKPGDVDGQVFEINDCTDCTVTILDYCEQTCCNNLTNCRVLIGPCVGSIKIDTCVNCRFTIACKQLRLRYVTDCEIHLYSVSAPVQEYSHHVTLRRWNGAYPKLKSHFTASRLDPNCNRWREMFDFSKDDGSLPQPHFVVDEATPVAPWVVPCEGHGEPENPVTAAGDAAPPEEDAHASAVGEMMSFGFDTSQAKAQQKSDAALGVEREAAGGGGAAAGGLPQDETPPPLPAQAGGAGGAAATPEQVARAKFKVGQEVKAKKMLRSGVKFGRRGYSARIVGVGAGADGNIVYSVMYTSLEDGKTFTGIPEDKISPLEDAAPAPAPAPAPVPAPAPAPAPAPVAAPAPAPVAAPASPPVQLFYFNVKARAHPICFILEAGQVPYVWDRANLNWGALKPETPFGQLPYVVHGDVKLAQAGAIAQYCARLGGLEGKSAEDFAVSQMLLAEAAVLYDLLSSAKSGKSTWEQVLTKDLPLQLASVEKILSQAANSRTVAGKPDSGFFGSELLAGDCALAAILDLAVAVEPNLLSKAPLLGKFLAKVKALPAISTFLESGAHGKPYFVKK